MNEWLEVQGNQGLKAGLPAECGQPKLSHEMADVEGSPGVRPPVSRCTSNEGTGAVAPAARTVPRIIRVDV